ncbi:MAG: hypothetical protein BZ137_09915 [Methanosphaera sp. rholeuAM130]|nr:MAG: hypothetical protein BZ137_09915 [Methanosphaera sp. rholeuAM130]
MIKCIAKVYYNQKTTLPVKIRNEIKVKDYDVVKWIYNSNKDYVKVEFLQEKDLDIDDYHNQIFFDGDLMILYRRISLKKIMHFPAEISKSINFNYLKDFIEWYVNKKGEIYLRKYLKGDLMDISGILKGD